jgi:CubicO group peptidase (beta-lactamase class C family)
MSAILIDPKAAGNPSNKDTIEWGGAYGSSWWVDRSAGLTVVIITNTSFAGMSGQFPSEVKRAIYDALQ